MREISRNHPLRRHMAGLVEQAFCADVGMCDPRLTDYVSDLLVDFIHIDTLRAIRNNQGKRLEEIATALLLLSQETPPRGAERDRLLYRQIGDYTLFWAGLYPEQLRRSTQLPTDLLLDYVTQGKHSYAIVSKLADEDDAPPSSLFRHLSEDFEMCLHGLGLIRRGWEENYGRARESGGDLLY